MTYSNLPAVFVMAVVSVVLGTQLFAQEVPIMTRDCNRNGAVNLQDVQPFVDSVKTNTYLPEADSNYDGTVNLLDVDPFIDLLSAGGYQAEATLISPVESLATANGDFP